MAMTTARMLTHNVYYYTLNNLVAYSWNSVRVIANSVNDLSSLSLPTVAIVPERTIETPFEIGSNDQIRTIIYIIQCYCKSDGQRDDLGDFLMNLFSEKSTNFLDYNDGFPPASGQTVLGNIYFRFLNMSPISVVGSPHPAEKHRMDIRMSTEIIGI